MSNSIPADNRELKIDELEMVSGGSKLSFAQDVITGATLGALGITFVQAVTNVVLDTAQHHGK